nr:MAG TPA: hypothetical protein [Caudoviricetes sp.]
MHFLANASFLVLHSVYLLYFYYIYNMIGLFH